MQVLIDGHGYVLSITNIYLLQTLKWWISLLSQSLTCPFFYGSYVANGYNRIAFIISEKINTKYNRRVLCIIMCALFHVIVHSIVNCNIFHLRSIFKSANCYQFQDIPSNRSLSKSNFSQLLNGLCELLHVWRLRLWKSCADTFDHLKRIQRSPQRG